MPVYQQPGRVSSVKRSLRPGGEGGGGGTKEKNWKLNGCKELPPRCGH